MSPDRIFACICLRRTDGSIDIGFYLDRARDRRNARLADWLRAPFAGSPA